MVHRSFILSIILLLTALSCTSPNKFTSTSLPARYTERPIIRESLFNYEGRTISEEDIQRLLNGRVVLADSIQIAVYKFGIMQSNRYKAWNDEDFMKNEQTMIDSLNHLLKKSRHVEKVITMPELMTAGNPTINELRETAVRLQADVLLIFSTRSDLYYRYKMFSKNEAKSFATCEAILLDTRTGMVPFSTIVTRESLVSKENNDWNDQELRERAEEKATFSALISAGIDIQTFLGTEE